MMMFDDKVGGWEWLNDDVISLIQVTDFFSGKMNQNYYVACSFFFNRNKPCLILALFIKERKKNQVGGWVGGNDDVIIKVGIGNDDV